MLAFRGFLLIFLIVLVSYTLVTIMNQGINLFPYFFGDMMKMGWAGQFNLDFMGFLILSATWTIWRNGVNPKGVTLGLLAFFGGMAFLTIYLLYLSYAEDGDIESVLVGKAKSI